MFPLTFLNMFFAKALVSKTTQPRETKGSGNEEADVFSYPVPCPTHSKSSFFLLNAHALAFRALRLDCVVLTSNAITITKIMEAQA